MRGKKGDSDPPLSGVQGEGGYVGGCAGGNKFGRNARVAAKWGKVTPTDYVCSPCDAIRDFLQLL